MLFHSIKFKLQFQPTNRIQNILRTLIIKKNILKLLTGNDELNMADTQLSKGS